MNKASLTDRIRYAFDNTMSKGPIALIGWLALASAIVILVVALVVWFTGIASEGSLVDQVWGYLMQTLGADSMTDAPWSFRLATLLIILSSIFVMSTLIGVLTTGLEDKLDELRKGRSRVIEVGHTAIPGWSPQVFTIISELVATGIHHHLRAGRHRYSPSSPSWWWPMRTCPSPASSSWATRTR